MKSILRIFRQSWLITLIGLVALAVLVWFGGEYIAIADQKPLASPVTRLLVIMAMLLLWGLYNVYLRFRANKANNAFVDELSRAPDDASADGGAGDEEVALLKERFDEAMQVLRKAKLPGSNHEARLYELPWYIVIGPPGSGKTTALINSDLHFPLAERFGRSKIKGVGGTRNCDWWFTNEAVILDTAGRYVTHDTHEAADAAAWAGFLELLRKHRRRRPINGVIVAVSVADLLQQTEYEREQHAQTIRRRIKELNDKFGITFPVYLLITKCDLVAGFIDYFDDLGRDERAQVWGTTFPLGTSTDAEDIADVFDSEFKSLLERLSGRLLSRLNHERDLGRRNLILNFPQQMAALQSTLTSLVRATFRPSRYEDRALLRGVYFTSGTQEGTPIDRLMGSLGRAFGVDPQQAVTYGGPGKSFFLTRLFTDVIFPEAELAGTSRRAEHRRSLLHTAAYAAAIIVTVGAALVFSLGYTQTDARIAELDERIDAFLPLERAVLDASGSLLRKLPALATLREATQVFGDGTASDGGTGMLFYQGSQLDEVADAAYGRVLEAVMVPHVVRGLEQQMHDDSRGVGPVYEALSVYLSLSDPSKMDRDRLRAWMTGRWAERIGPDAAAQDELTAHLDFMLEREMAAVELNEPSLARARHTVCREALPAQVLRRIHERLRTMELAAFQLDYVGSTARKIFTSRSGKAGSQTIPGVYTRAGYDAFVTVSVSEIPGLYEQIRNACALKTALTAAGIADLSRKVDELYFAEYARQWETLMSDVALVSFTDLPHAVSVLDALSGPQSPLRDLLLAIEKHTSLSGGLAGAGTSGDGSGGESVISAVAGAISEKAPGALVRRRFKPVHALVRPVGDAPAPILGLLSDVAELRGLMAEIANAPEIGEAAIDAARRRIARDGKDVIGRLRDEAGRQIEPVKSVLRAAARNSWAAILQQSRVHVNSVWKAEVLPAWGRLQGRYPLSPGSPQDAAMADFARFFGPGGVLEDFFENNLAPFVSTSGRWRAYKIDGLTIGISHDTLEQIRVGLLITSTLFPEGSDTPGLRFSIRPVTLVAEANSVTLTMDGQMTRYRHGPIQAKEWLWPGPERPGYMRIAFTDRNGAPSQLSVDGDWALFRVLSPDVVRQTSSPDRVLVTFKVGGFQAVYELWASSVQNPFANPGLFHFQAPKRL